MEPLGLHEGRDERPYVDLFERRALDDRHRQTPPDRRCGDAVGESDLFRDRILWRCPRIYDVHPYARLESGPHGHDAGFFDRRAATDLVFQTGRRFWHDTDQFGRRQAQRDRLRYGGLAYRWGEGPSQ